MIFFICSLIQLESLELRENLLRSLPASISKLTKLERLDLGDNEIEVLPSHLGNLPSLQVLIKLLYPHQPLCFQDKSQRFPSFS